LATTISALEAIFGSTVIFFYSTRMLHHVQMLKVSHGVMGEIFLKIGFKAQQVRGSKTNGLSLLESSLILWIL
jgi:hypothetical protein